MRAHVGGAAADAADQLGAGAFAVGQDVAFGEAPDLRQAAHEAAHVVQQRAGVQLDGGMGEAGDQYEKHADSVAEAVVQGRSAEALLDTGPKGGASAQPAVQLDDTTRTGGPTAPAVAPPAAAPIVRVPASLVGLALEITTIHQLGTFARAAAGILRERRAELPGGSTSILRVDELIEELTGGSSGFQASADGPLNVVYASTGDQWVAEIVRLQTQMDSDIRAGYRRQIETARRQAETHAARLREMQPRLDEERRTAFLAGDEDRIRQIADATAEISGLGETLASWSSGLGSLFAHEMPTVAALGERLGQLSSFIGHATTAQDLLFPGHPISELSGGLSQLSRTMTAIGAVSELFNAVPLLGSYLNDYLIPMTQAIVTRLDSILTSHLHDINTAAVASGGVFSVDWSSEPGGQTMGRYMVGVMRARSGGQVVAPTGDVAEYFVGHRDRFTAAAGRETPVDGWVFHELGSGFRQWVFDHREALWASLYGSWRWQDVERSFRT